MSFPFNSAQGLIIITAIVTGPRGDSPANLTLDTGATETTISRKTLTTIGCYPPAPPVRTVPVMTSNGLISVPLITIDKLEALGQRQNGMTIQAHTLPPSLPIDGVLGLDFLRNYCMIVDFRAGQITLT